MRTSTWSMVSLVEKGENAGVDIIIIIDCSVKLITRLLYYTTNIITLPGVRFKCKFNSTRTERLNTPGRVKKKKSF